MVEDMSANVRVAGKRCSIAAPSPNESMVSVALCLLRRS